MGAFLDAKSEAYEVWVVLLRHWLGKLQDRKVLCLGSGGGQQAPLLAAAGARGTSFDLSDEQLALDR